MVGCRQEWSELSCMGWAAAVQGETGVLTGGAGKGGYGGAMANFGVSVASSSSPQHHLCSAGFQGSLIGSELLLNVYFLTALVKASMCLWPKHSWCYSLGSSTA